MFDGRSDDGEGAALSAADSLFKVGGKLRVAKTNKKRWAGEHKKRWAGEPAFPSSKIDNSWS